MGNDARFTIEDRLTTSFGLNLARARTSSGEVYVLEDFGVSEPARAKLAYEQRKGVEARISALAGVTDPILLKPLEVVRHEGKFWVMREDVKGTYLTEYVKSKKATPKAVVKWMLSLVQLAEAYRAAGLSLRGISDCNVIVTDEGSVRVIDPGIALELRELRGGIDGIASFDTPESILSDTWTEKSDMFCLGLLMYESLTGRRPFDDQNSHDTIENILKKAQIDPRYFNPDISSQVVSVVDRLLAKDPEQRYASFVDLTADLMRIVDQSAYTATPEQKAAFEKGAAKVATKDRMWRTRRWARRNRTAILAVAAIALAVLAIQSLTPKGEPYVTADMTSREVIDLYFVGLDQSDVSCLEEIIAKGVPLRGSITDRAARIFVLSRMRDMHPATISADGTITTLPRVHQIDDLEITPISEDADRAVYEASYVESTLADGARTKVTHSDRYTLTKVNGLWRITDIELTEVSTETVPLSDEELPTTTR